MKKKSITVRLAEMMKSDPIALMFIIDAIDKRAAQVLVDVDATRKAFEGSFISGDAWIEAATRIKSELQSM
jgi:hypothetical protein